MKKIIGYLSGIIIIFFLTIIVINYYIIISTKNKIIDNNIPNVDCILVLGAGLRNNNPSPMLKDRLDKSIELYNKKISKKLLMSGDHTKKNYDEVNIMKEYAINSGITSDNIFMDHAGISTYDSIYRAKYIFGAKRIIIVTQKYHLYRALFIANKLGIEAYGVETERIPYSGDAYREIREILARNKDFIKSISKPQSKYLGEKYSLSGNGDVTND